MVKIAIWCRHAGDNIIGIGPTIPWHVSSDFKRFKRITQGKSLLVGEKTYESFPNHTLPNRKIYVLTFNKEYEVSDSDAHFVLNDIADVDLIQDELYISGGASIYKLFMEKRLPDIVVESVYQGELDAGLTGDKIDVTPCVTVLKKDYEKITQDDELDNILTSVWVKKGITPNKDVLNHIIKSIEER